MLFRHQAQLASSLLLGWFHTTQHKANSSDCAFAVLPGTAVVFLDRLFNPRYVCSPLP